MKKMKKTNALGSATYRLVEFHAFSANTPKMLPCSDFMIVRVFVIASHSL